MNQKHAFKTGLVKPRLGENNELHKLSNKDVIEIREKYRSGLYKQHEIAEEYNVSQSRICMIVNNKVRTIC